MMEWTREQFEAVQQVLTSQKVCIEMGRWRTIDDIVNAIDEDLQVCAEEIAVLDARELTKAANGNTNG